MTERKVTIQMREEGSDVSGNLLVLADVERPRAHSAIAPQFQYLKLKIQNDVEVDRVKRSFKTSKGQERDFRISHRLHQKGPPKNQKEALMRQKDDMASQILDMDEHSIPLNDLCLRLGVDINNGLSNESASSRNLQQGFNKLPEKEKTTAWIRFLKQMTNWFALMQGLAAVLCIVLFCVQPDGNEPNLVMAFVIIFIVLLTASITYMGGAKSHTLMGGLKKMIPDVCRVRRKGQVIQISSQKLARGDIVLINQGDRIPADMRIIKSDQMRVDNSALTGEVESLLKSPECTHPDNPFLTKNLLFFGTLCLEGRGEGIVIQVGAKTIVGQIAGLAASGDQHKSPFKIELDRLILIISIISVTITLTLFFVGHFAVKYSLKESLIFVIGIILANAPEGLLACTTIFLSIGANRLAERGVLVKNLQSVSTLGSTSCFCLDKTGTITQNKMVVENLWIEGWVQRAHNKEIQEPNFKFQYDEEDPSFKILQRAAVLSSEATLDVGKQQNGDSSANLKVIGDSWQSAILKFYQPLKDIEAIRNLYPLGHCQDGSQSRTPFDSTSKYSLSIVREEGPDHHWVVYIKGAPEKIWTFCSKILKKGESTQIDAIGKKDFNVANRRFCKNGQKVLGFAMLPLPKDTYNEQYRFLTSSQDKLDFQLIGFVFIGLISFVDPLKENVRLAIQRCRNAGIKVIMISGDQVTTTGAIANKIGLLTLETNQDLKKKGCPYEKAVQKSKAIIIHGDMITEAYENDEDEGDRIMESWCMKKQVVFARTTRAQKLLVVKAAQRVGLMVGVLGGRVEDSPAIKQGDIGISMNLLGSEVTKDAADMILLNDDLNSLIDGVQEGRKVIDNLKKSVVYILTSNMSQIWPFVAMVIFQIPLPLSASLLLIISVGTDIYPALSLSYEEAQADIMTRRPRKAEQHLLSASLLGHSYGYMGQLAACAGLFTYNIIMSCYGIPFSIYLHILSKQTYIPMANDAIDYTWNSQPQYSQNFNDGHYSSVEANLNAPSYFTQACFEARTNGNLKANMNFPYWLSTLNSQVDLRVTYVSCCGPNDINFCSQFSWPDQSQVLNDVSPISGVPVMFTTEALFYAQSGYFVTIVMIQWVNLFCCKSRKMSIIYSKQNYHTYGGILLETCIFIFILYVPSVNEIFGGRPLPFFLMGVPGLAFSLLLLGWEELRKLLMSWDYNRDGKPNWFERYLLW